MDPDVSPPALLAVLMTGISQVIVLEEALGVFTGHAETRAMVEQVLRRLDGEPGASAG